MELRYYSFVVNFTGRPKHNEEHDIKMPAVDLKIAVCLFFWGRRYVWANQDHVSNKHIYHIPTKGRLDYLVHVIEYEKIDRPSYGKTLVQYKKVKTYSTPQIMECFKNSYLEKSKEI